MSGRLITFPMVFVALVLSGTTPDCAQAQSSNSYAAPQSGIRQVFANGDSWAQSVSFESDACDAYPQPCGGCQNNGMDCCAGVGGCDDLFTRTSLTGGLFGLQPKLAEHGIITDLQATQFYQGVSSGGSEQKFRYGGKNDYMFTFLGGKMGLNDGFTAIMHAESRYGESLVGEAGAFAFPNTNMLYPLPSENETAITGLLFMQALDEKVSVAAGKINVFDFWNMVYPHTGRGIDGFMNLHALAAGMPWLRFVNLSVNGAGVLVMEGQQIEGGVLVFDTNNSTTTSGIDNLFDQGVGVLGIWRFFHDWDGKAGSHLFALGGSTRTYTSLDPTDWAFLPGQGGGLTPGENTGTWAAAYYFNQVVWADPCNAARNIQVFSGCSLSDGKPSFARWNGMATVEGYGLIDGREKDRMGAAYFYVGVSDDLKRLVRPVVDLQDVQGVEFYYNAEVTPWFHVTADLQVVDNENAANDTSIITGLRANVRF